MAFQLVRVRAAGLFVGLLMWPGLSLAGQSADAGTLVIRSQGHDIGLETFRRQGLAGGGDSVALASSFPGAHPHTQITAILVRRDPKTPTLQLLRRDDDSSVQWYATVSRNRLVVRHVERNREQAHEYPAPDQLVMLADSTFALYSQMAGDSGRHTVAAVFPTTGQQVRLTVDCEPGKRGRTGGQGMICRVSGGISAEIELSPDGGLRRVSLPGAGLEAVRQEE
jgi:hypothetical protein